MVYNKGPVYHFRPPEMDNPLDKPPINSEQDFWDSLAPGGGIDDSRFFHLVRLFDVAGVAEMLRRYPPLSTAIDEPTGGTALHIAAAYNCRDIIRLLVNTGVCDYTARDRAGRTPTMVARRIGSDPVISRFLAMKEAQQRRAKSSRS